MILLKENNFKHFKFYSLLTMGKKCLHFKIVVIIAYTVKGKASRDEST